MTVRAKFKVDRISKTKHWDKLKGDLAIIDLSPVTSGSPENEAFYAATPSGKIELSTIVDAASSQFELGKFYYVDFSPAD